MLKTIANRSIRNLLRGLLDREHTKATVETLNHIRRDLGLADAEEVYRMLVTDELFAHLPFGDAFPTRPPHPEASYRLETQHLDLELVFQLQRIAAHETKLVSYIEMLAALNASILRNDAATAISCADAIIATHGYSLILLRKVVLMNFRFGDDGPVRKFCQEVLELYRLGRRNAVVLSALDIMDPTYDFLTLRRSFDDYIKVKKGVPSIRDVVAWNFRPVGSLTSSFSSELQSMGLMSLIDVLVYIGVHQFNIDTFAQIGMGKLVDRLLPKSIQNAWRNAFEAVDPSQSFRSDSDKREGWDLAFYRQSTAWLECQQVTRYRAAIDVYFGAGQSQVTVMTAATRDCVERYFGRGTELAELAQRPSQVAINIHRLIHAEAGRFTRTLALLHWIRSGEGDLQRLELDPFLTLLDITQDVARLTTIEELRAFLACSPGGLLADYVSAALMYDCTKRQVDAHAHRRTLQRVVLEQHGGDLIAFIRWLQDRYPIIAKHLFYSCTEPFLIHLFLLFPEAALVLEMQAKLFEWAEDAIQFTNGRERARAIRVEQRLQRVRGDVNDIKLYVDPVRFIAWQEDHILERLNHLLRLDLIEPTAFLTFSRLDEKPESQKAPFERLAEVLQDAFVEFTSSKFYGIDSYVGRRIRHGTLEGTMQVDPASVLAQAKYRSLQTNPVLIARLREWRDSYVAEVRRLAAEVLHIRSRQKPEGFLVADVTDATKLHLARETLRNIVLEYQAGSDIGDIAVVVYDYCWLLLEPDLQGIRERLDECRTTWGTLLRPKQLNGTDSGDVLMSELVRDINVVVHEKFRTIRSWFARPSNLTPSAPISLLFEAVLQDAMSGFPGFRPLVEKSGPIDQELYGRLYQYAFDYLEVCVRNAAKHGKHDGRLRVEVVISDPGPISTSVSLKVFSEIKEDANPIDVARILAAAAVANIDDAMIVEGSSGMRKLRRLEADAPELAGLSTRLEGRYVIHEITMALGQAT